MRRPLRIGLSTRKSKPVRHPRITTSRLLNPSTRVIHEERALTPAELGVGRPVPAPGTGEQSTPSELGEKKSSWLNFDWTKKEEYGTFTGEPPRVSLTDPPAGYQTPSPDQPYGITPEHKVPKASTLEQRVEPVH